MQIDPSNEGLDRCLLWVPSETVLGLGFPRKMEKRFREAWGFFSVQWVAREGWVEGVADRVLGMTQKPKDFR
jgi:hypothetical protein